MSDTNYNTKRTRRKNRRRKDLKDYVQDFIPIKKIRDGIIETTDGRFVKILEIEPINFLLRSAAEQMDIIYSFAGWFKIANVKIQFKSITKKADSERHILMLKKDMADETNEETIKMSKAYIKLIHEIGGNEALTRHFYLIFEYEPPSNIQRSSSFNEIKASLTTAENNARIYLARCGNNVIESDFPDGQVAEILYGFFNRRSSLEKPFGERVNRVNEDMKRAKGLSEMDDTPIEVPVINYIAPRGLDLSHVNYIIMDGLYYTFLYIKADGYKSDVYAGWTSALVNAGEGIDVDMFFSKQDKVQMLEKVSRKIILNTSKMVDTNSVDSDYEEVRDAIGAGYYIKESLSANNEDFFYMSTIITINAKTLSELRLKKQQMINMLKSLDLQVGNFSFQQETALLSTMPLLNLDRQIETKIRRNIMTSGAAGTYMFTAYEMCDDNGILLGINEHNSSLCIIDLFNSRVYKNANMCILGTSGAGKTFTEQLMALRMRMRGIQCFIVAPLKGHEFRRACESIGGTYIKISSSSNNCINVMAIRPADNSFDKMLEGEDAIEETSALAKKIEQLHIFMKLLIPDLNNEEEQLLDEAFVDTYAMKGITHDNETLYDEDGELKTMPILGDLYTLLSKRSETRRLATILSRFVTGSAQTFNQQTNVDLSNKYIVMDISELKGTLLPIGMFIALDYVWDKTKEDRSKKKAIFIDETWMLIGGSSNKYAAEFVLEIFKIIRGYGGAAIAATQDLNDFFALEDGKYGKGIINNSKTKIVLNLEPDEADFVRESMKLSEQEYQAILHFERGHALICTNSNHVPVIVRASEKEKNLITTDAAELRAAAALAQKQREREKKAESSHGESAE